MADAWVEPALEYLRDWLAYQMRVSEHPGVAIAVALEGEVVLDFALGHASLAASEALSPRHRFRVASHSKAFTAAGVMRLREAGRLKLDDRAGDYVEGLHPGVATATIGQLLSHSAGLVRDGPDCDYWVDRGHFLDETALRHQLADPPTIGASERLKYSNHGFGLVGLVIEKVTGEPYAAWITREVIARAGLVETTPDAPPPPGAPFARGHGTKALLGRRLTFPGDQPTHALAPATGFVSTAADLARFFAQLSPTAATALLSQESRREMTHPRWTDRWTALPPQSYGLGTISAKFEDWDCVGHSGGFLGYVTRTAVVPAHAIAVSCLTNAVDGMSHLWLEGALGILKRFKADGPPAAALAGWRGRWWSAWGPSDLVPVGERVLVAVPAATNPLAKATEITVIAPNEGRISQAGAFANFGEPAGLIRADDGAVASVRLGGGRLVKEDVLAAELLARYEGRSST